jgi:hypothetical protein
MALKTIEQEWRGFAATVLPNFPPESAQYIEMKKAFFAGAWAMFAMTEEIGEDRITEEQGLQFLEERRAEILAFKDRLLAEYAGKN